MSHRKLIRELRKAAVSFGGDPTQPSGARILWPGDVKDIRSNMAAANYCDKIADLLSESSAYYMDGHADQLPSKEIYASAVAMIEADVFKAPSPLIYIEMSNDILVSEPGSNTEERHPSRIGVLIDHTSPPDAVNIIIATFLHELDWPKNEWMVFPGSRSLGLPKIDKTMAVQPWFDVDVGTLDMFHEMFLVCEYIEIALIVLLATRGIESEFVPIKDKIGLKRRAEPVDGYTIVHVHRAMQRQHQGGVASARHRVRLHMRAGHGRRQRYGPRLVHMRRIWIEPTLIGYEEEGRIDHDYRVHNPEDPMGDHPDA